MRRKASYLEALYVCFSFQTTGKAKVWNLKHLNPHLSIQPFPNPHIKKRELKAVSRHAPPFMTALKMSL